MSTIDPQLAQAEKVAREKSSGAPPWPAIGFGAVHLVLWALGGYGIASQIDTFRLMEINQVGAWDSPYLGDIWMLIVGITLGSILGFVFTASLRGRLPGGSAAFAPFVTGFLGLGLGFLLFFPSWTKPEELGFVTGFAGEGGHTAWGAGAWVWFELPIWMPILFGVLTVLTLLLVVRVGRSQAASLARVRQTIRAGTRVTGVVTQAESGAVFVNNLPVVTMTIKYTDATGTDRWVTQRRAFAPTSIPRLGDPYTVFYDPQDPSNQRKIIVFPGNLTAAQAAAQSWS